MHFTLKELCELTNQPSATVANICTVKTDTDGHFTILSYYYVCLISQLMQWCTIDVLKAAIPFEHMAPMIERANMEEEAISPLAPVVPPPAPIYPYPAAGMVYANWEPTVLGGTEYCKVKIDIYWRLFVRNARETLLEWLLAERGKGGTD